MKMAKKSSAQYYFSNGNEDKSKYGEWYENGQQMIKGNKNGTRTEWYDNGQVKYKNGRHGEITSWFKNGQLQTSYHYINGKFEGAFKTWTEKESLPGMIFMNKALW
jgi:antitoxin component YwqK of YwqJK toxin-antitoxin module